MKESQQYIIIIQILRMFFSKTVDIYAQFEFFSILFILRPNIVRMLTTQNVNF